MTEQNGSKTVSGQSKNLIMQVPLPEILDNIGTSIAEAEGAAAEARVAAEQARLAGEKAAEVVLHRIKKLFLRMSDDITREMHEVEAKP